ncbi:MAG: LysM peptidoglycan-binding domain-containing protein [Xanthomonadales bacterium]|nr:LysM peptidoglycan-binding domain-containing protein [Xanthomonadales bacterium]NNL94884.1 LysM peptidoglycan-binding domain-containing protein [Xanthomonadales bacterium]
MSPRLSVAILSLFIAACASTGQEAPEAPEEIVVAVDQDLPRGSGESIDEHLFEPEPVIPEIIHESPLEAPHVHPNVWERLVHRFELPECSEQAISRNWAQWYADRPEYMARVLKRAQPWIFFIAEELERRGMPAELALLPIVESAYDPFAYSSGRAMGAWQFIASTGRSYGLKQNWWYDGRRDVWASTHAALDYLEDLRDKFDGDWLLALAGYNSGENRVARRVKRNVEQGKPADFWNISLPRETRGYVPKLLGLTCLFRDAEDYGFKFPSTANAPVIAAVDPGFQADLVLISQISGVDIDVVFSLNPGFNRWATSPEGPHRVVLPIKGAQKLQATLQQTKPMALMKWDQVTVQPGDTLGKLANVHQVPVSVIRTANGLDGDLIRAGQKLRLPRDEQLLIDPLYATAANELQRLQSGLIASDRITHRVRSGESLSVIARRYKVSQRDLQVWNKISDPHKLRAGQELVVFHSPAPAATNKPSSVQHTVQSGDSLWSIARKYKVRLKDLMRWNGLDQRTVIRPGQSIKILF